jgi:hypothetical protein
VPENEHQAWHSQPIFDSEKSARLADKYLNQAISAEEAGFDAFILNEDHDTPSPSAYGASKGPRVCAPAFRAARHARQLETERRPFLRFSQPVEMMRDSCKIEL